VNTDHNNTTTTRMIPSQPYKLPSPEQMKEDPVMPPTPAERLSIHKVKNGWTLDVDYAAMRQFGDSYSTPGYVYTKLSTLAFDVVSFLRHGVPSEHAPTSVAPPPTPTTIDLVKREAFLEGVRAGRVERDEAITLSNSLRFQRDVAINEGNKAIKERDQVRKECNDAYARGKHEGETNERNTERARDAGLWTKVHVLEDALSSMTDQRDAAREAYTKVASLEKAGQEGWERGYKSGVSRVMAEVKRISANICANIGGGAK
jgi:hypothetical protein